ncbi:MAG: phenylacetate--CoA ligase [Firmicutes bacterium]|nr:phenylacetate--CoA ligase [Bacillota bacterium]
MEKYYDKMETAPLHEIRALQSLKLSQTVRTAYEKVPFYRNLFDKMGILPSDIQSVDDIHKLPFTVKQDLRDNYPYGLFAVPPKELSRIHASSGTTGKQTVVGYTKNDLDTWATCCARALVAAGGSDEDYVHVSYGYGLFTGGMGLHYGAELLGASVIPVSSGNTPRQLTIMQDFGSTILCCTPSYALYLGESLRENGIDLKKISLKAGIFGAEPWTENMRLKIQELLGIKAYDIYGLSEVMGPGVSYECSCQTGMHINEDFFIPEIIDPDTLEPLPEGTAGELVFTCIGKEALPLLRYRTRDIAVLTREKCECGRTFIKMKKVSGRTDDMLIIRGVNVFPSQIEEVLLKLDITAPFYQLVVDRVNNTDSLEVMVEILEDTPLDSVRKIEEIERKIRAALDSVLGIAAKVTLVPPKSIARSEGKAVRVIDKRIYD